MSEIRIPNRLVSHAVKDKKVKALRLLSIAKLHGHRVEKNQLFQETKIHPKTGKRLIEILVKSGWAGYDGKFLFPRSWDRLQLNKRGGLYISKMPTLNKFEALLFAKSLKTLYSKLGSTSGKRKDTAKDFPALYISKSIGIKQRRFEMLKASAQRYRFISVTRKWIVLGKDNQLQNLKKNLPGVPVFKRGKQSVVPDISKIRVLI